MSPNDHFEQLEIQYTESGMFRVTNNFGFIEIDEDHLLDTVDWV